MRCSVAARPIEVVSVSLRPSENRGTARLLRDCALVGQMIDAVCPPARHRLEQKLGNSLLRTLMEMLSHPSAADNGH